MRQLISKMMIAGAVTLGAATITAMPMSAHATTIELHEFDSVQQEARYRGLIEELRCPTCQNQNLAGSDALIALDLRKTTYELIKDGRTDAEIREYMFERYGDYISYKPPVRPSTWILWFFPPLLLILLILGWIYRAKKGTALKTESEVEDLSAAEEEKLAKILSHHQSTDAVSNHKDKP